jgi:hypothetical protein
MSDACPGCGLIRDTTATAVHRYMTSSPGCWERFGIVLAGQYRPERMPFHQLSVDAYAASHAGDGSQQAVQSVAIHLMTLCLFLENGVDPIHGPRLHRFMVERPVFTALEVPELSGRMNVGDITLDGTNALAEREAWRWARDVWDAHANNHTTVRKWLAQSVLAPGKLG